MIQIIYNLKEGKVSKVNWHLTASTLRESEGRVFWLLLGWIFLLGFFINFTGPGGCKTGGCVTGFADDL